MSSNQYTDSSHQWIVQVYVAAKHTIQALGANVKDSLALPSKNVYRCLVCNWWAVLPVALEDIRKCIVIVSEQSMTLKDSHSSRQQHKRHKSSHRLEKKHLKCDDPAVRLEPDVSISFLF